jgi:hypothetical protein
MKYRIGFLLTLFSLIFISCNKESFPDNEDLKGNWVAVTTLMDQEQIYFDGIDTMFYANPGGYGRYLQLDTLIYRLNKKHNKLYLSPVDTPGASESIHKISINPEKNELTITGLHGSESESKFEKQ